MKRLFLALGIIALFAATAQAQMRITEFMYGGTNGEFVEFTNVGASTIDMTGWSYSDTDRLPGDVDLSAFGVVATGESVILTEASAANFRSAWSLAESLKIIGSNANSKLGRNDEINLYDSLGAQADCLTFGDETYPGTIRTQNVSGNPGSAGELGANHVAGWVYSSVSDQLGSYTSTGADIGNPGHYAIPEPASVILALIGLVGAVCLRWRNRKK